MHDKTAPGPKQQPNDAGDSAARRGSAAPDRYWVHDDVGPCTYVPVNAGDGAPLPEKFAQLLRDFPQIIEGQVTLRDVDNMLWLEGWVDDEDQSTRLEAAVTLIAGGRHVRNVLAIG
ncbi:hypothetical protein [Tabrizicola sp. BL-A-41-H6]|uniref:hypothetical protein n=1 Tax=Tabrizicola sp. BL-A-41-H6 TaxID=3421107 RepID=UPI003D67C1E2